MNRVLKTSWLHRYGNIFLVILSCLCTIFFDNLIHKIGWVCLALLWTIKFFFYLNHSIYMKIHEGEMTIYEGRKIRTFSIVDIEFIKMNYHPFGQSFFQLKDGEKIDFNPRTLSSKDAESLKEVCADIRG